MSQQFGDPRVWIRRNLDGVGPAAPSFDPSIMQAMNWNWPLIIQAPPKIVESGSKPSNLIPQ